jgi:4-oxalmesaconate hydratase
MIGAVKGIDPQTGHHFDDTKRYVLATPGLSGASRADVFFHNQLTVYPRVRGRITA